MRKGTYGAWFLMALLAAPSCLFDCEDVEGGTGGGSGGSDGSLKYSLVEVSGDWSLTGERDTGGGCVTSTTNARVTFALPQVESSAASYSPSSGFFSASATPRLSRTGSNGTTTCPAAAPRACPQTPDKPVSFDAFMLFDAQIPADAADGFAFVPTFNSILPLELCDDARFVTTSAWMRGRPVSVAELKSGRFVIESQGTSRIEPGADQPDPLTGTFTWSYRFVFQTADYDAAKAVVPPVISSFDHCLLDSDPTIDDLEAAAAAYTSGVTDIPLNASGCQRLFISRAGNVETQSYRVTRGTKLVFDPASGLTTGARDEVTVWERDVDPALQRERFDSDRDGLIESTGETLFENGAWKATTLRELVPGTSTVIRQVTQTRIDGTTMAVHREEAGSPAQDFVTTIVQEGCFNASSMTAPECAPAPPTGPPPACVVGSGNCSATELRTVKGKLAAAMGRGTATMSGAMASSPDLRGKALAMVTTGSLTFKCSKNPCDAYGSYDGSTNTMMVNLSRLGDPAQLNRTLFHEMLHSDPRFTHNDRKNRIAEKACKLQITDRTYACEVMAFGPQATACVCNRCLTPDGLEPKVETCEYCRQHFPACLGRQEPKPDGGIRSVAAGVGAWCERLQTFCDTAAECDTECSPTGSRCQRDKSVCDRNCN